MDDNAMGSFLQLEEPKLDLSLHDYKIPATENSHSKSRFGMLHPGYRRLRSATTISLGHERKQKQQAPRASAVTPEHGSRSSAPALAPTVPAIPNQIPISLEVGEQTSTSGTLSTAAQSSFDRPTTSSCDVENNATINESRDSSTEHYLDSDARLKLKRFLAMPSNFDEALKFGFPSLLDPEFSPTSNSSRITSIRGGTMDSQMSPSDEDTGMIREGTRVLRISRGSSHGFDKEVITTNLCRPASSYYEESIADRSTNAAASPSTLGVVQKVRSQGWLRFTGKSIDHGSYDTAHANREMTLRLTLTRPDLRANDSPTFHEPAPHGSMLRRLSIRQKNTLTRTSKTLDRHRFNTDSLEVEDTSTVTSQHKDRGLRKLFTRL